MACDSPIFIKLDRPRYSGNQPIYSVNVACGKCYNCLRRRINQWAFRLIQEDRRSTSTYFITLTYDTDHVPLTKMCNLTLKKDDLQKFFKRLRYYHSKDGMYLSEIKKGKSTDRKPIKYYACGEYGGLFGRPHYHAIIFNAFPDQFEKAWTAGNIQFREADTASIFYTLKYIEKKESKQWHYDQDVIPEFALRSKGLGSNYITEETKKHHTSDLDNNYVQSDKFKIALPRYYAKAFWPDGERDANGNSNPHPHKVALLGHIKKSVQDDTDKMERLEGANYYANEAMRKKARKSKIGGYKSRGF